MTLRTLVTSALLMQSATVEHPRAVSWQTYSLIQQADRYAEAYNRCVADLAEEKVNYYECRRMHKEFSKLQKMEGWPKK